MDHRLLLLTALLRGTLSPGDVASALGASDKADALLEGLEPAQRKALETDLSRRSGSPASQGRSLLAELGRQNLLDNSLTAHLPDDWQTAEADMTIDREPSEADMTIDREPADPDVTIDPGEHHRVLLEPASDRQQDPHSITRFLAEGGLGQVFVAQDTRLGREVVLKQLQQVDNDESMGRFMREAQVTGQLEHPNIVPIYGLGWDKNDAPYYTMKYVRGRTLADLVEDYHRQKQEGSASRLQLRELLDAFLSVCNAVGYSHTREVVHRDLKPENIAVGEFGEVIVLDWGLAKLLEEPDEFTGNAPLGTLQDAGQTIQGRVMGTPNYMPPEQARGEIDSIDTRADIYSLGAILFHILAGSPPRQKNPENLEQLIAQVAAGQIPTLRERDRRTPRELDAICSHAMNTDPADRYQTVAALSDDLKHWLVDEPVSVCPDPWPKKAARWARNHKAAVTTAVSVAMIAVFLLASATIFLSAANLRTQAQIDEATREQENYENQRVLAEKNARTAITAEERAESAEQVAQEQRDLARRSEAEAASQRDIARQGALESRRQLIRQHIARGMVLAGEQRSFEALLWFTRAYEQDSQLQRQLHPGQTPAQQQARLEEHQLRIHNVLSRCPLPVQIWQPKGGAGQVRFSPTGTVLASCNGHPASPATGGGQARLWDALTGQPLSPPLAHDQSVNQLLFHHDGTLLATAAGGPQGAGSARVWQVPSGAPAGPPIPSAARIVKVALHPGGTLLATASADGSARVWQIDSGTAASEVMVHDAPLVDIAFSPDGRHLVTAAANQVRIWDATTGTPMGDPASHNSRVLACSFSKNRGGILTVLDNGNVLSRSTTDTRPPRLVMGTRISTRKVLTAATLDPYDNALAAGDKTGALVIYQGIQLARADAYQSSSRVDNIQFSANGEFVAASTQSGHVIILDSQSTLPLVPPLPHPRVISSFGLSANGRYLATSCRDGLVRTWDLSTSIRDHGILKHGGRVTAGRFGPAAHHLVTSSADKTATLWDLRSQPPHKIHVFEHPDPVSDCFLVPGEERLVTVHGSSISTWDLAQPSTPLFTMKHGALINDAHLGPAGMLLITASTDRTTAIWNLTTGAQTLRRQNHTTSVRDADIGPDGRSLVTAMAHPEDLHSSMVEFWNGESRVPTHTTVIPGVVHSVRFLPAIPEEAVPARILTVTGSLAHEPGEAQLWDFLTGQRIGPPMPHTDAITFVDISHDGRLLLTASRDTSARLWSTIDGSPLTPPLKHPSSVLSCNIRTDGHFLVTACTRGTTHIWDTRTGNPVQQGPLHRSPVRVVAFHPAGDHVLSADDGRIARIWPLRSTITDPKQARQIAQLLAGHQITHSSNQDPLSPTQTLADWQRFKEPISGHLQATIKEQFAWLSNHGVTVNRELWLSRITDFDALLEISPQAISLRMNRGYAHICAGQYDKAMADYLAAYQLDKNLATLAPYCYLAAYTGQRDILAKTIPEMIRQARSNSDRAIVLLIASLLPNLVEDYTPLLDIAAALSTEELLKNVYICRAVGAIYFRSGDPVRASQIFLRTPTANISSRIPLSTLLVYFALSEQSQGKHPAAAQLVTISRQRMTPVAGLHTRRTGPAWMDLITQEMLLREYQDQLDTSKQD